MTIKELIELYGAFKDIPTEELELLDGNLDYLHWPPEDTN